MPRQNLKDTQDVKRIIQYEYPRVLKRLGFWKRYASAVMVLGSNVKTSLSAEAGS